MKPGWSFADSIEKGLRKPTERFHWNFGYPMGASSPTSLFNNRYVTFDELSLYCYRVASVVGLICLHVFGVTSARAQDYAVALGMAFQLTNILRDVGTDAAESRIYLPLDDLRKWNHPEKAILNRSYSPEFRALMEYEASRAHHYYKRADAAFMGLPPQERRALTVAEIMRGVYSRILERIEQSNYQVFGPRISLTNAQRMVIALRVWLRSRFS
ncbi:MAG: squalene/phytoene synthase family protein [Nitrospira sp.]|nr:squalene/phytoene synthase family protein [Nitrospira sp.]